MKSFPVPTLSTHGLAMSLLGLCLLSGLDSPPANADFIFGTAQNLGPVVNSPSDDYAISFSADGLELYFSSDRPGGYGLVDLWVSTRASTNDLWGPPVNLGPAVNSPNYEAFPSISSDGLTLYFSDEWGGPARPAGVGGYDIWMTRRTSREGPWDTPVNVGAPIDTPANDITPMISADGLTLIFASNRAGGRGGYDVWMSARTTLQDEWGEPVNMGGVVNSASGDLEPSLSPDKRALVFASQRPGGYGFWDLWMTTRKTQSDAWGTPVNLGPQINSEWHEGRPVISADGRMLHFYAYGHPGDSGRYDLWEVPIIPIIDFNGDGWVDALDLDVLVADWGKSSSVCDIGPFAWGDGVVDEKDLGVLMKSLVTPSPGATDVPCDAVVSWTLPSFAQACDVYLGTSQEAVNTASRANPQGVLVSQGQTATTCQPAGLLDLSRTYYWRVDFVSTDAAPVIYQGPVLQFTTGALTYPLKNITATASSAQAGSGPERTVDGSGLDESDGHSTDVKDMWWTLPTSPHWIQYEFDKVYTLHELWVWNFNMAIEPLMGFGAKTVKIEYSTDGTTWTALADVPEFAQAPGKAGYTANTIVSFAAVSAKFVKLTIEKNWGVAPQTGLSEVRFFCIQSAAVSP